GAPLDRVEPANGAYKDGTLKNLGFYVVGPQTAYPVNTDPMLPMSFATPDMSLQYPMANLPPVIRPTILLRRLACPHLPPQPNKAALLYTPYVTVDYYEGQADLLAAGSLNDLRAGNLPVNAIVQGRVQPYAAHKSQWMPQNPQPVPANQPKNTFFRHN